MMKRFMFAAMLLFVFTGASAVPPKGTLVIVGGGATPEGLHRKLLDLAGGPGARVLVAPLAGVSVPEVSGSVAVFRAAGGTNVEQISAEDPQRALKQVRAAEVIWFPGGSQSRLMEALRRLGVVEAIRERYAQGAVVGGTSAGAAVMSRVMIAGMEGVGDEKAGDSGRGGAKGKDDKGGRGGMKPKMGEGLGLCPWAIVDQHFVKRGREPRLSAAVQAQPELVGIGIDESTYVLVHGDAFDVGGESSVIVLDARGGGEMKRTELKAGARFALGGP